MPELPEVETVKRGLEKELVNHKVLKAVIYYPNIISACSLNKSILLSASTTEKLYTSVNIKK